MKTKTQLEKLRDKMWEASENMEKALREIFPTGSEVEFYLATKQKTPSKGIVLSISGADLKIKMHSLNRAGYNTVKGVYFRNMVFPK